MCGIVGAVRESDTSGFLLEGLRRLEYRGYDSAGVVVINQGGRLERARTVGKVAELERALTQTPLAGTTGLAHTRWATHGGVSETNAHPHICNGTLALVCNGIVENHEALRHSQQEAGLAFTSQTDTEVVVHQVYLHLQNGLDLADAVRATMDELAGSFALAVVHAGEPGRLVAARQGPPLLLGRAGTESFVASDINALLPVTRRYQVLENGDVADIRGASCAIKDSGGSPVERVIHTSTQSGAGAELGEHRHFMQKEIHEQPRAVSDTLEDRLLGDRVLEDVFGSEAGRIFDATRQVLIIACGTSYHAGLVARHWLEYVGVPCEVEVASEYRYRRHAAREGTLVVTISQSGETADTLAALEEAKRQGVVGALVVCNVAESSLVRESDLVFMTHCGPEVGVASTKTFVSAMTGLLLLALVLSRRHGFDSGFEAHVVHQIRTLPGALEAALAMEDAIAEMAQVFSDKEHALFLGRGAHFPIAMEGALKLKEISYIHAEAYPAGELKHGPLALVDEKMPVVAVAPNDLLIEKLKSNLEEVRARRGRLYLFADPASGLESREDVTVLHVAPVDSAIAPIIYTVPLQLLSYHVALIKGTDVDKPRNLAKSVTVE
ncbi:MAG: glutamine--fructose-6-phosphate transaminase (isomerizing) [Arenicellales bacterium]|jgi:glucosamine--fructose-6-phosphate aminotransferase (isomerizing)|nr:glutamine--fructose-6-phosphate transaminase (isomerizing) [Arenicellales bacterium]MDP6313551.1 glutamine--fructose-6-phosphate transaminase (isomerizing) [Arenicellales bacterium]MDP7119904.1 glutamine--fructose-6-phosphate transaminase (isomerizing) [Arenicellales bacterium]MDP7193203.1 glutamine--fructose-6-phosphate transaminase (isomerizing) [Arenicellales bacterium]MDP7489138.1 glutamine--fructose-6-phosphate transaminase (isomerizing) [Arenicellales bacterium]